MMGLHLLMHSLPQLQHSTFLSASTSLAVELMTLLSHTRALAYVAPFVGKAAAFRLAASMAPRVQL